MDYFHILIVLLSSIAIVATLLQVIDNSHWVFRVPVYLSRQLLWLTLICFILILFIEPVWDLRLFQTGLVIAFVYLVQKVFPYTRFGKKDVETAIESTDAEVLTFLMVNVYQYNTAYEKVASCINSAKADIVLLVETDHKWKKALQDSMDPYPEQILLDREDTYGMFLLSRYPIIKEEIRTIYDETPSIRCVIDINGERINFFGLHPKPPSPTEAPTSEPKDAELDYIAGEISALTDAAKVIVMGDINDVAWSRATKKLLAQTKLKDPRKGRGSIVTFPTYAAFMGFPLDQVFCSSHFAVKNIKRLPDVGSDHYPLYTAFTLST